MSHNARALRLKSNNFSSPNMNLTTPKPCNWSAMFASSTYDGYPQVDIELLLVGELVGHRQGIGVGLFSFHGRSESTSFFTHSNKPSTLKKTVW